MLSRKARLARIKLGWTVERLAEQSGVSIASVYLLERLGTAGPDDDARILGCLVNSGACNAQPEDDASATSQVTAARFKL